MKFKFILLFLFISCKINQGTAPKEESGNVNFYAEQLKQISFEVTRVDPTWRKPLEKTVSLSVCLKDRLTQSNILPSEFSVKLAKNTFQKSTDDAGCLSLEYSLNINAFDQNKDRVEKIYLTALTNYSGSIVIPLRINPGEDTKLVEDARFVSKVVMENGLMANENKLEMVINKMEFDYIDQSHRLHRSMEMKMTRNFQIRFRPRVIENKNGQIWEQPKPINYGQLKVKLMAFSNQLSVNNFKKMFASCHGNCLLSSFEKIVNIEHGLVDDMISINFFHHDLVNISDDNLFILFVEPVGSNLPKSAFIGSFDPAATHLRPSNLKKIKLTNKEKTKLLSFELEKKSIANLKSKFVSGYDYFNKDKSFNYSPKLNNLLKANIRDLSLAEKSSLCNAVDKYSYWTCMNSNYGGRFKIQKVRFLTAVDEQDITPIDEDQHILNTTIQRIYETRSDKGHSGSMQLSEGLFEEGKVSVSTGGTFFGNGATAEAEAGIKFEQKRVDSWYLTKGESSRHRGSSSMVKEFTVDEIKIRARVRYTDCLVVRFKTYPYKKYFTCEARKNYGTFTDSYYYLRNRNLINNQIGIIDTNKSSSVFRKTLIGSKMFNRFREKIHNQVIAYSVKKQGNLNFNRYMGSHKGKLKIPFMKVMDHYGYQEE